MFLNWILIQLKDDQIAAGISPIYNIEYTTIRAKDSTNRAMIRNVTFDEAGEKGDVGGLPPAAGQLHPDPLQLVPQHLTPVLALRPEHQ